MGISLYYPQNHWVSIWVCEAGGRPARVMLPGTSTVGTVDTNFLDEVSILSILK